ncbi:MAG: TonB-dependent receptor [Rikenella sp.]|nr:TonB-dependent receptor [Rikenella sp.]
MGNPTNSFEGDINPALESTASLYEGVSFGPRMDAGISMRQNYKLWQDRPGYEYNPVEPLVSHPDNWKALFQTAKQDNVSVALTGGSEKATYRLSYSYTNMNGALPNNSFDRHSVNFRTNGKINDIFSVDFSMQYSNSNTLNAHYINGYTASTSFVNQVTSSLARNTDLRWFRDNYIDYSTWERMVPDTRESSSALLSLQSTLNEFTDRHVEHTEQTIISRLALNAQLTDWLDASASISYNYFTQNDETKNWGSEIYRRGSGNTYAISGSNWGKYNSLITLHSNNRFLDDNLELDVRLINEIYGNQAGASYSRTTNGGLKVPGLWSFANTADPISVNNLNASWNRRNNMVVGLGGVINLSWKDQINLEVTGRNDWISSLLYPEFMLREGAHDNYSVFYPSVNLSWVFSDTFNIDPSVLSFGKLRASWGQVGSGTDAYATSKGAGGYSYTSVPQVAGNEIFSASPNNSTLPNYDLKPEIQQSMEFGADLRFLNGAIGVDVAYYKINTKNQILTLPAISESGVSNMLINAGNIQNQGWEIQLDFRPIQTNTVRWDIGLLWSRNRGKVKELHPNAKTQIFYNNGGSASYTPAIVAFEGGAFGQIIAGTGYGSVYSQAYYYNNDDPNDPLNGKKALRYRADDNLPTTLWQTNNNMPGRNINSETGEYYANYYNDEHPYDVLGNIEADFNASFTTNVMVNLPNNNGSLDFFAQIDGRVGGKMVSTSYVTAMGAGAAKSSLYGRDQAHGGLERVNYKGETVYNGMILDGVYAGRNAMIVETLNGEGSYVNDKGETVLGSVDLRGMTMQDAVNKGYIAPMLSSAYYYYQYGWSGGMAQPTQNMVYDLTYFSLREITVGYNFPQKWIKHVGLQDARISFSARNICYLYNKLPDKINPESMSSANPLVPIDWGGVPYSRNFSINLNLRF